MLRSSGAIFDLRLSKPRSDRLTRIPVPKPPHRRNVAADVKIHDIAGMFRVINPLEVDDHAVRMFGNSECRTWNAQMQLLILDVVRNLGDVFPRPTALVPFETSDAGAFHSAVHDVLVALPACAWVAIGV